MDPINGPVLDYNATFINDFGVALLNVLAGSAKPDAGSGGTFVSPVSVMLALALLLNGAAPGSSTFWQLLGGMNLPTDTLSGARLSADQALNDTNAILKTLITQMRIAAVNDVDLNMLNSIWLRQPYEFSPMYAQEVSSYLNATAKTLTTAKQINAFVKADTSGRITSVMTQSELAAIDVGVLINAVFFKSPWQNKFSPVNTIQGNFSLSSSPGAKTVSCNMMNQVFNQFAAEYAEKDGSQAIRIPFSGHGFYAIFVLPGVGSSLAHGAQLLRSNGRERLGFNWTRPVGGTNVALPRFSVDTQAGLKPALTSLGITNVFSPTAAQLSAVISPHIADVQPAHVNAVRHTVNMKIDENGAQAQAVTELGIMVTGGFGPPDTPPGIISFRRPFVVAIQHYKTGALVFLGTVTQPSPYVAPTAPLLNGNNTVTMVHGAHGQSTALETPGDGAPVPSAATLQTPPAGAAPATGPMPISGQIEGADSGPMTGQALLNVISLSEPGFGRKLLRGTARTWH